MSDRPANMRLHPQAATPRVVAIRRYRERPPRG
jgi:hypothetical protein